MDIQDITVGQFIIAQDVHGGDINKHLVGTVLVVGTAYEVVTVDIDEDYPEQPIAINVPNNNLEFWVNPKAFKALEK